MKNLQYQLASGNWSDCEERTEQFLTMCEKNNTMVDDVIMARFHGDRDLTRSEVESALNEGLELRNDREDWYSKCRKNVEEKETHEIGCPAKEGQLWERCQCGQSPVYLPLHLCDRCWPETTDPRFTRENENDTTTCGNHTLIVTLPTEEFKKIGRYGVFNDAMRMLGNKSEHTLLKNEPVTEVEVDELATDNLVTGFLKDNGRYDVNQILMRMHGGYSLSAGMAQDIDRAKTLASVIMDDDFRSLQAREQAMVTLEYIRQCELDYREKIGDWCNGWEIEIVGEMPEQIGLCRYEEAAS